MELLPGVQLIRQVWHDGWYWWFRNSNVPKPPSSSEAARHWLKGHLSVNRRESFQTLQIFRWLNRRQNNPSFIVPRAIKPAATILKNQFSQFCGRSQPAGASQFGRGFGIIHLLWLSQSHAHASPFTYGSASFSTHILQAHKSSQTFWTVFTMFFFFSSF